MLDFLSPEFIGGLEKGGILVVAVVSLIVFYKVFTLFMEQWKNSTDAVNKNTTAFDNLSKVFEQSSQREMLFQQEVMQKLNHGVDVAKDTNERVRELQRIIK